MSTALTLIDDYQERCSHGKIQADDKQIALLQKFQLLLDQLNQEKNYFAFLTKWQRIKIKNIYLFGGVGIGKTFIMDLFYHHLHHIKKMRIHFFEFMQFVHHELSVLQGKVNPLNLIAKKVLQNARVLCFDEFFVKDITDAMLLSGLLKALLAENIILIITSNLSPDELYLRGIQRELFLPAIELIKKEFEIVFLPTKIDYRIIQLSRNDVFFTPCDKATEHQLNHIFSALTQLEHVSTQPAEINNHQVSVIKRSPEVIWFDFAVLCHPPRNSNDYLFISKKYKTLFLSNIPKILSNQKNIIILFIRLIDILYDNKIHFIFSADVPIHLIYTEGMMITDFARTKSRLIEMQSYNYLRSI